MTRQSREPFEIESHLNNIQEFSLYLKQNRILLRYKD
jgi:hypothetical protein